MEDANKEKEKIFFWLSRRENDEIGGEKRNFWVFAFREGGRKKGSEWVRKR